MPLARDCAAAYQNALHYSISGDTKHADTAIGILNLWSSTNYTNCEGNAMTAVSASRRGTQRPSWELLYNHCVKLKGLVAPYTQQSAEQLRPEGCGGDYGTNSGGFDQLGFGTLTFSR
jgi:hypothetical protein